MRVCACACEREKPSFVFERERERREGEREGERGDCLRVGEVCDGASSHQKKGRLSFDSTRKH